MTISLVIFSFGLLISGIVALGIANAQEYSRRQSHYQRALDRHQANWRSLNLEPARIPTKRHRDAA